MRYRYLIKAVNWLNGEPLPKVQRLIVPGPMGSVFIEHEVPFHSRIRRVKKNRR